MKKWLVLILLVLLARLPLAKWQGATEEQQLALLGAVGQYYHDNVDQKCGKVEIMALDGRDGFIYIEANCVDGKKGEISL